MAIVALVELGAVLAERPVGLDPLFRRRRHHGLKPGAHTGIHLDRIIHEQAGDHDIDRLPKPVLAGPAILAGGHHLQGFLALFRGQPIPHQQAGDSQKPRHPDLHVPPVRIGWLLGQPPGQAAVKGILDLQFLHLGRGKCPAGDRQLAHQEKMPGHQPFRTTVAKIIDIGKRSVRPQLRQDPFHFLAGDHIGEIKSANRRTIPVRHRLSRQRQPRRRQLGFVHRLPQLLQFGIRRPGYQRQPDRQCQSPKLTPSHGHFPFHR